MAELYVADIRQLVPYGPAVYERLPESRREKTLRIRGQEERLRSAAAGLLLRFVFGEARAEALLQNEHGKPFFEHGPEFCLSHSGFYAVLAAGEAPLGVDLEAPAAYRSRIAMRCFTPEERVFAESRENGFCLVWTKKEAVMKAAGVGFALSPASFSVLENPCAAGGSRYHLAGAEYDGYAVALASKEEIGEIRFRLISAEELLRGG
ncbi:MAG TPA: 4'-phosphopantetheinyl transferase superfamily protein [Oscillospiraceae bacterium]|nr:4'-phosphopantetheinyl transferase superfamily protein [Oscillospiraceae bacterium]HNW04394.1 4'-phosphopantetheinyl transferase superfamily protein [Oscillospiraceae bacterium]